MREKIKSFIAWVSGKVKSKGFVVEIGSYQVEGQEGYADLRPYFPDNFFIGIDIRKGKGVDVIQDIHSLGIKDNIASWVLCIDTLEHVKNPLKAVEELKRILKDDGILIISSVMDFPIHEHPYDYWRFTPQIFYEMLDNLNFRKIFFQGDKDKPHTIIGVGSKRKDLILEFPAEILGEPLILYKPNYSEQISTTSSKKYLYNYKIDLSDPNSTHSKILRRIKPNSKVLEIGCATGYMTKYLKEELNCKVTAIEIDEVSAMVAKPFTEKLIIGDVEILDLKEEIGEKKFDYIILADVLEHLKEPEKTILKLKNFIKENGSFLISIPNASHASFGLEILDGNFDYRPTGLLDSTHLRFFTISTFLDLLERSGLWAISIDRVKIHPKDTEFRTLWEKYPREITAYIENVNPEFDTYQFVIVAKIMNKNNEKELIWNRYIELKESFNQLQRELNVKNSEINEIKNENAKLLEKLKNDRLRFQDEIDKLNLKLKNLEKELVFYRFKLSQIENSLSWRFITKYRNIIEKTFPKGTRRRNFYDLSNRGIQFLLKEGFSAFLKKSIFYLKRKNTHSFEIDLPEFDKKWHKLEFKKSKNIDASIIIPVHNKSIYTFNCLKSLLKLKTDKNFEVIVIDDASKDDTPKMMKVIEGVKYFRFEKNQGFIGSCNKGAELAKGKFLIFLNNDTIVTEKWLDEILKPFEDKNLKAGLVGSKLIFPDGKLQEAGGIIFNDGSAWNFGKWDNPDEPEYNYLREVDYCSGASIAIPRELFEDIGGFDTRFAPAFYEDTDLAMEVRKRGYKVIYNPSSVLFHFEGVTCGKDINKGIKKYQEVNKNKFFEKWKTELQEYHFPPDTPIYLAKERNVKGRIMIIDHYVPTPDMDSGSLRLFTIINILKDLGWKVIFWPDNLAKMEPYVSDLQRIGVEVYYGVRNFTDDLNRFGKYLDAIYLLRPHIAPKYVEVIKNLLPNVKLIYDTVDLHFVREARRARIEKKKDLIKAAKRLKNTELYLSNICDKVIVLTKEEEEILRKLGIDKEKIVLIPNIHEPQERENGFENREGLMFIGGFVHPPNVDAMVWFTKDIFPLILESIPDVKLFIVGSNPPDEIKNLSSENVEVLGYVKDVSPIFKRSKVFISPLRYGAGLKGKIGQSLSFGLPVVTTSIGAEGFVNFIHDEDELPFLIADNEKDFAMKVVELYTNKELWERLSNTGIKFIEKNFSKNAIKPQIETLLNSIK